MTDADILTNRCYYLIRKKPPLFFFADGRFLVAAAFEQFLSTAGAELGQHCGDMMLDGPLGAMKPPRDISVR